jgi:perosamine synthetase
MKVRLFKPSVGDDELNAVREVFQRAWLGLGPKVSDFERAWSEYIGCKVSVGVNSATAALHLALAAFEFPRGKKVLVPAITFISTATAALYNGLEPVFVDVDRETVSISLEDLEKKYSRDCVAIIPVHFGGHPAQMDKIIEFARLNNLVVIEDCAHAAGGTYKNKKLGTWGDIGCFSFEEKKCMTTGDGGMICTDNEDLAEALKAYRWVGIDKDTWKRAKGYTEADGGDAMHWYYEIAVLGYKYNMNDLSASIGLVQLTKLDSMNEARLNAIRRYLDGLKESEHIRPLLPYDLSGDSAYWLFGVRCRNRDDLILHCKKKGIATGVHYMPLPLHPLFPKSHRDIKTAEWIWREFVTLPLFADLTEREIDYVIEALQEFDRN